MAFQEEQVIIQKVVTDQDFYAQGDTITVTGAVDPAVHESVKLAVKKCGVPVAGAAIQLDEYGNYLGSFVVDETFVPGDDFQVEVLPEVEGPVIDATIPFHVG